MSNAVTRATAEVVALWILRVLGVLFVALAVLGAVRNFSPVPWWDMWEGYIDFYLRVSDGQWERWWMPHNEHRIVLSRLLFWVDLRWFGGSIAFLIAVNFALAGAAWLTLRALLHERLGPTAQGTSRAMLGWFMLICLFSWMQRENLTWGFQSQFFLAQWLPLVAFYLLYRSTLDTPERGRMFVLACVIGTLCIATMASGVIALPLMLAYAALLRMSVKRLATLAALTVLCLFAYYVDYKTPTTHGNISHLSRYEPSMLARYVLLYLGSPFYWLARDAATPQHLGVGALRLAQVAGAVFVALALLQAVRALRAPRANALALCLLTFVLYLGGTALGTGLGRLLFGLHQAASGRYTTPALMAWMALLVLYAPALLRCLNGRRHLVLGPMFVLVAALLVHQVDTDKNFRTMLLEHEVAALALELSAFDRDQLLHLYPTPEHGLYITTKAARTGISVFARPWLRDVYEQMGQPTATAPAAYCRGALLRIDALPNDEAHQRISGWIAAPSGADLHALRLIDSDGRLAGYALAGPRGRVAAPEREDVAGMHLFKGYMRAGSSYGALALATAEGDCALRLPAVPRPAFRVRPYDKAMDRVNVRPSQVVSNAGWEGSDYARTRVPGFRVLGSYQHGDADTGTLVLRLKRGEALFFRSTAATQRQLFAVDDGKAFQGKLPGLEAWVALVFDNPDLPPEFTLTLTDAGVGLGEWSAVGILDK